MSRIAIDVIKKRLDELGMSARAASLRVSENPDLLRNVLRRGDDANITERTIELLAQALELPASALRGSDTPFAGEVRPAGIVMPSRDSMSRDIKVFGTAAGSMNGRGAFQMTSDPVDYVARPPGLIAARDIYALYVEGESMVPRHMPGDLVFVHPHKPVRVDDSVIIQEPNSQNGQPAAFIKIFKRRTEKGILTRQLNPESQVEFVSPGTVMHKVLTLNELFGV